MSTSNCKGSRPVDEIGKSSQETTAKDVEGAPPEAGAIAISPIGVTSKASDASPARHEAAGGG